MIFRILTGKHRARPLQFGIWWNRKEFAWKVMFTNSCRYNLGNEDQYDYNKLCGIGYLPGFHHKDSARFGWRYRPDKDSIELSSYCYVNKQRVIQHVAFCEIGKPYSLDLRKLSTMYFFTCRENELPIGTTEVPYGHRKKIGYRLGVYFGGNRLAPHEIKIELEKL